MRLASPLYPCQPRLRLPEEDLQVGIRRFPLAQHQLVLLGGLGGAAQLLVRRGSEQAHPPDLRPARIAFERFARMGGVAGNRAADAGFGLGLSLVGEHVRLHGGQVWVTDRIDGQHGARFVVQLPLGPDRELHEEMAS